jgi:hypothetical protein
LTQTPRHMRPRDTTFSHRREVIRFAIRFMERAGVEVEMTEKSAGSFSLQVFNPPDSSDPHGDRLQKAIEASS